jgi:hypothetical protein
VRVLAALIIGLVLVLLALRGNDGSDVATGQPLLPELQAAANTATQVVIRASGSDEAVTIQRTEDRWTVGERGNYAADVSKLRQLVIALADADVVEEKTSNPEQYEKLGVGDPDNGGTGTKVTISGPDYAYTVILGNKTQGKFRYVRVDGNPTSYLIDKDPTLPSSADDWLLADILDIAAQRVQKVSISHADGETIVIAKDDQQQTDFVVRDIPDGRKLSYPTVANGIAGALGALKLEGVRARIAAPATTTVAYALWNGVTIGAEVVADGDQSWVSFAATMAGEEAGAADEAAAINARLDGWQYRLPEYKQNLLTRRWDDILQAAD